VFIPGFAGADAAMQPLGQEYFTPEIRSFNR